MIEELINSKTVIVELNKTEEIVVYTMTIAVPAEGHKNSSTGTVRPTFLLVIRMSGEEVVEVNYDDKLSKSKLRTVYYWGVLGAIDSTIKLLEERLQS